MVCPCDGVVTTSTATGADEQCVRVVGGGHRCRTRDARPSTRAQCPSRWQYPSRAEPGKRWSKRVAGCLRKYHLACQRIVAFTNVPLYASPRFAEREFRRKSLSRSVAQTAPLRTTASEYCVLRSKLDVAFVILQPLQVAYAAWPQVVGSSTAYLATHACTHRFMQHVPRVWSTRALCDSGNVRLAQWVQPLHVKSTQ